jgi:integrase
VRGGIGYQITEIFNKSGIIQIGNSKHEAKAEAREAGAKSWADMGKALGIYSYKTADTYKDIWHQFTNYTKAEFKLKDIEKTSAEHVQSYLESRISDGVALATIAKEAAALGKLENALNLYSAKYEKGNQYNFRDGIREIIKQARQELPKADPHRAYESPEKIIDGIQDPKHQMAARSQLESGARIHEISLIKPDQLRGIGQDRGTGERCGIIEIQGKGGKIRELCVSIDTYEKISNIIGTEGKFSIDKNAYRADLRRACESIGERYSGSHGLRWTYAQNRMEILQSDHGMSYEQSLCEVSRNLGHERPDITEHYLR